MIDPLDPPTADTQVARPDNARPDWAKADG